MKKYYFVSILLLMSFMITVTSVFAENSAYFSEVTVSGSNSYSSSNHTKLNYGNQKYVSYTVKTSTLLAPTSMYVKLNRADGTAQPVELSVSSNQTVEFTQYNNSLKNTGSYYVSMRRKNILNSGIVFTGKWVIDE